LRRTPDPDCEITLPGNDAARWREAEEKLRKIECALFRALKANDSTPHEPSVRGKSG
jgi:hypothetical protein